MIPIDFKVTCSKVKVKPLFSSHCVVRSISFDPFTWSIPNLVQGLRQISIWSLLIFRSHVQMVKVKPLLSAHCVVHSISFLSLADLLRTGFASTGKINLNFAPWGAYMFWNISCFNRDSILLWYLFFSWFLAH